MQLLKTLEDISYKWRYLFTSFFESILFFEDISYKGIRINVIFVIFEFFNRADYTECKCTCAEFKFLKIFLVKRCRFNVNVIFIIFEFFDRADCILNVFLNRYPSILFFRILESIRLHLEDIFYKRIRINVIFEFFDRIDRIRCKCTMNSNSNFSYSIHIIFLYLRILFAFKIKIPEKIIFEFNRQTTILPIPK